MGITRTGFQSIVNAQPAPGEPGDFAGTNIRSSASAPPGGYVADSDGVVVGRFAWGNPVTGLASNVEAANRVLGFVHRENQTIIVDFLGVSEYVVREGLPVTLMSQGDFWATFVDSADVGDPVYVDPATGIPTTSSGGSNILTNWTVASPVLVDAAFTASIAATGVMTVSAVGSGVLAVGQYVSGAGVPANTRIVSQLTGSAGDTGTYQVSTFVVVSSGSLTATAGKVAKITTWY